MSLTPNQQPNAELRRDVDPEKAASEFYARWTEPIRYLLVAHGTALVVSISALKDQKGEALAKHVGQVAGWFAIGFSLAVIGYAVIVMHRDATIGSYNVVINIKRPEITHGRILLFGLACVALSTVILIFTAFVIACRVWSL